MNSLLYLGLEGVLFANRRRPPLSHGDAERAAKQSVLVLPIINAVQTIFDVSIVLNSWWVADYGYRSIFQLLPDELACKTIGATMPGNRTHRRPIELQARADILRSDIARRNPHRVAIVDAFSSAIPFEYLSRSLNVSASFSGNIDSFSSKFFRLLVSDQPTSTTDI